MRRQTAMVVASLLWACASAASAGTLRDAMEGMKDGRLRFTFETREGVWGNGHKIVTTDGEDADYEWNCDEGPGRIQLTYRRGQLQQVKFRVGGRWGSARDGDTDLGEIPADEVSVTLLDYVREHDAEDLVFAATVAKGFSDWKKLLDLARDSSLDSDVREQCVFWLGQQASEVATRGLQQIVDDDDEELELREHAIFALSQQDGDVVFESLRHIALTNRHPQLREQAMFWLAQVEDPRVLDFFEEVLFAEGHGG